MTLNIKYFGLLAEITGCDQETYLFSHETIGELLDELFKKYPELESKDFQVAHAMEISDANTIITQNEIALLPPFSGG